MNQKKKLWMVIMLALFTLVVSTACDAKVTGSSVNLEDQFDGSAIDTISVYSPTAKVFLGKSKDDRIHVKLSGTSSGSKEENDELIATLVNGSELTVKVEPVESKLWKENTLQLAIQVPDKTYEKFVIETSSGDIKMDDLAVNLLDIEASSGNIEVPSFHGLEFKLKTSSGNIDAKHLMGKGDVKASSGEVQISLDDFSQSLSVETSSGDAKVYVPEHAAFHIEAKTTWTEASINLPVTIVKNEDDKDVVGKVNNAETAPTLQIKTSSGKFLLDKTNQ